MVGAALVGLRSAGRRLVVPLAVCADADRQPRGRDAARAPRSCAKPMSSSARTRGIRACLLERHGIEARLLSYHEHNEAQARRGAAAAARGRRACGARQRCRPARNQRSRSAAGRRCARRRASPVTVLPGPSAVETALVASGLGGRAVQFLGYLPRGRPVSVARSGTSSRRGRTPSVAFESPQRLPAALAVLARSAAGSSGRGLPRADEALRGSRARVGRGARCAVLRAARRARSRS